MTKLKTCLAVTCVLVCAALTLSAGARAGSGHPKHIVLLQTNDIHGGVEPVTLTDGTQVGGMAILGGIVQATRQGVQAEYGADGGVLMLDDGDQFQGTLISNINEGQLVFDTMATIGYDVGITGNHDYDFGPIGWLDDTVTPDNPDQNPRGALLKLLSTSSFPLISANTYYVSSFFDISGQPLKVDGRSCAPEASTTTPVIDWSRTERPDFLKPYLIKSVAGVRVALIGIDNFDTNEITTVPDVVDLCFGDEASAYLRMRAELSGQADVFVMLLHDGDADGSPNLTNLMKKLTAAKSPDQGAVVDAVLAGHTHYVNNVTVAGIHGIQSGANGRMFGRIDLVWDQDAGKVDVSASKAYAGVQMYYAKCDTAAAGICAVDPTTKAVKYEGMPIAPMAKVQQLIAAERALIAPMAGAPIGTAPAALTVDRTGESPLADLLTDLLRQISGADVAFMNTGGIRTSLGPGNVTYEDLFRVLPFNNHGVLVGPMKAQTLLALLERSAQTCGDFGALMQSGLKVTISKDCKPNGSAVGTDPSAKLLHVETVSGDVILDTAQGIVPAPDRVFQVATLDFLAEGGSGFTDFEGVPLIRDLGIEREVIAQLLEKAPRQFSAAMDGRWVQQGTPASPGN